MYERSSSSNSASDGIDLIVMSVHCLVDEILANSALLQQSIGAFEASKAKIGLPARLVPMRNSRIPTIPYLDPLRVGDIGAQVE